MVALQGGLLYHEGKRKKNWSGVYRSDETSALSPWNVIYVLSFINFQYSLLTVSAEEGFNELCFDFGLELDDVVVQQDEETKVDEIVYKVELPANRFVFKIIIIPFPKYTLSGHLPGQWSEGGLSEVCGHGGPGICLGDGQTEA